MRTEQNDAYLTSLRTHVVETFSEEGAEWIVLGASLLYPTSGGQAHDEGWIHLADGEGGVHVVDVVVHDGDTVRHRIEGRRPPGLEVGAEVEVTVDWPRRHRHMQRHGAQHLLSQAFLHVDPSFETAAVALTSADCTVDLRGEPTDDQVEAAVDVAQDWAYRALPVETFEIDESDVDRWPLRRPPKVKGRIRLVKMGDVELSACGGTHVANTAELLPIVALGRKRIRSGLTRVTFRAGLEAASLARRHVRDVLRLARSFSSGADDVAARVEAVQADLAAAKRELAVQRERWARLQVAASGGEGPLLFFEDDEASAAALATAAVSLRPRDVVVIGTRGADRVTVSIQAGAECVGVDVRPALQAAMEVIGGRGGGREDRARGSGPNLAALPAAVDAARDVLVGRGRS